jgi:hypothetical protein
MYLNETYIKARGGKYLFDAIPVVLKKACKKGDDLSQFLFRFV